MLSGFVSDHYTRQESNKHEKHMTVGKKQVTSQKCRHEIGLRQGDKDILGKATVYNDNQNK